MAYDNYLKELNGDLTPFFLLVEMKDPSNILLKKLTFTWAADAITGTTAKFVKLTNKRTDIYGTTNVFTNEAYTYNSTHGGVLTALSSGSGGAENVTVTNTYVNKGTWMWRTESEQANGSVSGIVRRATYTYNNKGNLLTKTYVNYSGSNSVETYTYDAYGNVATYKDPKNHITGYIYDAVTKTHVTGINYPLSLSVSMAYNNYGKISQHTDENGNSTFYDYDEFGRLEAVDYPDGGETLYEYNDTANPVYVKTRVLESGISNYIDTWQYVDGFGRAIMSVSKSVDDYVVTRQYFDYMGRNNLSAGPYFAGASSYNHTPPSTYPTVERLYDYMGRITAVKTQKYNGSQAQFETTGISYNGFETTITDAKGNIRKEKTDYLGRIIEVQEDTGGGLTKYKYNAAGDLTEIKDTVNNTTAIYYNTLGQKTSMTDPDMGTWSYTYDLNGNLATQTDAKAQTITFHYDALNRVTLKSYLITVNNVTYTYDNPTAGKNGKGKLHTVTTHVGNTTTTYDEYDEIGRIRKVIKSIIADDQARTTQFTYDLSGRLIRTTYPDNFWSQNSYYPGTNLLSAVAGSDSQQYASIGSYTPSGKIKTINHGNNTSSIYTYDNRSDKLKQIETKNSSNATIQKRAYDYTSIGEIGAINDIKNNEGYVYTYDKLSRLKTEVVNGMTTSVDMVYNSIGNIKSKTMNNNTFTYAYNNSNHKHAVSSITFNNQQYNYTYDANGNMTSGPDFTNPASVKTRTITYNADNMPTQIVHSSGTTTALIYDGMGTRVGKSVTAGGITTVTYYIGSHFEIQGGVNVKYIFVGNLRVAQIKGAIRTYFHKDHLGSSTVMTNASGAQIESTNYMPFGSTRNQSGTVTSGYKFTDQELDGESGLYNYNARLYDPMIGRFISADSIVPQPFNPQSLNRYAYVLNNPLIYVDPSGHYAGLYGEYDYNPWSSVDWWNGVSFNYAIYNPGLFGLLAGPGLFGIEQSRKMNQDVYTYTDGFTTITVGPLLDEYWRPFNGSGESVSIYYIPRAMDPFRDSHIAASTGIGSGNNDDTDIPFFNPGYQQIDISKTIETVGLPDDPSKFHLGPGPNQSPWDRYQMCMAWAKCQKTFYERYFFKSVCKLGLFIDVLNSLKM